MKSKSTRYQETWIRGKPTGEAYQRECAPRYEKIKAQLDDLGERPFSVLDFGANMTYFATRIAEDYPQATVMAIDNRPEMADIARQNELPNLIVCNRRLNGRQLDLLAGCEAVDVVLCLNVLHHMDDWFLALDSLARMCRMLIVETPGPDDYRAANIRRHGDVREAMRSRAVGELLRTHSHVSSGSERIMMRINPTPIKSLRYQTMDAVSRGAPKMQENQIDLESGTIRIHGKTRPFVSGFNLWNIAQLNCVWPIDLGERVRRAVEDVEMDDLRPWNFIVHRGVAVPIDLGNKKRGPEPGGLKKCLRLLNGALSHRKPREF